MFIIWFSISFITTLVLFFIFYSIKEYRENKIIPILERKDTDIDLLILKEKTKEEFIEKIESLVKELWLEIKERKDIYNHNSDKEIVKWIEVYRIYSTSDMLSLRNTILSLEKLKTFK